MSSTTYPSSSFFIAALVTPSCTMLLNKSLLGRCVTIIMRYQWTKFFFVLALWFSALSVNSPQYLSACSQVSHEQSEGTLDTKWKNKFSWLFVRVWNQNEIEKQYQKLLTNLEKACISLHTQFSLPSGGPFVTSNSAICGLSIRKVSHQVSPSQTYSVSCRKWYSCPAQ